MSYANQTRNVSLDEASCAAHCDLPAFYDNCVSLHRTQSGHGTCDSQNRYESVSLKCSCTVKLRARMSFRYGAQCLNWSYIFPFQILTASNRIRNLKLGQRCWATRRQHNQAECIPRTGKQNINLTSLRTSVSITKSCAMHQRQVLSDTKTLISSNAALTYLHNGIFIPSTLQIRS